MEAQHSTFPGMPADPNMALTYDPDAGHARASAMPGRGPAMASGWVSTGFGLFQLVAPHTFCRLTGMPYPSWLIRAVGARDVLLGSGLLARPDSPSWRMARFANDLLDTTLIGAAVFGRSTDRRKLAGFAALAAAVMALDAWTAGQPAAGSAQTMGDSAAA
jgi:hypothetical protein